MRTMLRQVFVPAVCLLSILLVGCSELEPKSGTRVTFQLPAGGAADREKVAQLSRYLIVRSIGVLGVERPRVDSVRDSSLVLLLPGKKVSRDAVERLLTGSGLEFYQLKNVATAEHPGRPWHIQLPSKARASYIFTGPDAQRIDSEKDKNDLLADVVDAPAVKPVLTGKDILPNASYKETARGLAVLVQFKPHGSEAFYRFTRDNPGEYLAVFYNGTLVSAPLVKAPIKGGEAFITGFRTSTEAQAAVSQLNSGVLPEAVKVRSVEYY